MIKAEYDILNKMYPTAMSIWKDRMLEMDKGDILNQMIKCMEGPLLSRILVGIGFDITKSRENDND